MIEILLTYLPIILIGSVKYIVAVAGVVAAAQSESLHFAWYHGFISLMLGGSVGVLAFYVYGSKLISFIQKKYPPKKKPKKFSKMNRIIARVKQSGGIYGIALLTPPIISMPVGCLIAARYFSESKATVWILMGSVTLWSVIFTVAIYAFGWS